MDREFLESLGLDENDSRRILEEHGKEVEQECQRANSAETSCREAREALARNEYAGAVRCAVGELGLKFSSKAAERDFIARLEAENLELKDGRLEGLEAFVQVRRSRRTGRSTRRPCRPGQSYGRGKSRRDAVIRRDFEKLFIRRSLHETQKYSRGETMRNPGLGPLPGRTGSGGR